MAQPGSESSLVVIDEDGDTLLILDNPSKTSLQCAKYTRDGRLIKRKPKPATTSGDAQANTVDRDPPARKSSNPIVRYQVSSTMLKNASSYFRNTFSGRFSESLVNANDGKYHIGAQGFNPVAMRHVMNAIHVKSDRLPRLMDLEILADVAVLIDYYDIQKALSFITEVWTKELTRERFPTRYGPDLWLRTFVAQSFGDRSSFKRGAAKIINMSEKPMPDLGLPMGGLPDLLDKHRGAMIQVLIDEVRKLEADIGGKKWGCSEACKAMLLGNFMLKLQRLSIAGQPFHMMRYPFPGISLDYLRSKLWLCKSPPTWFDHEEDYTRDLDSDSEFERTRRRPGYRTYRQHDCDLSGYLEEKSRVVEEALQRVLDDLN